MNNRLNRTKTVAFAGLFAALALLLSYVESLIPPLFVSVPGVKMGLANLVVIYVLYSLGTRYASLVSFTRILLASLLFGDTVSLLYSVAGAVLSIAIMSILKKTDALSTVGVSVAGAVCHNIGQTVVAVLLLNTPQIAYYAVVLTVTGSISGIFIGICSSVLISRIDVNRFIKLK